MIKIIASLCAEKRLNLLTRMLKSVDSGVLVVPEQFLFEAERSMYTMLGARRIADTVITGLSKLAADVIKTHGAPRPYADDIVKSVTMHKTLGRLKSSFTYYRGEKLSFSFTQQMLELTSDLKAAAITPALLRKGEAEGISHSARLCDISAKLCDITEIYSAYCETLAVDFADKSDDLRIAAELIGQHDCYRGKRVYISEFDSFSASQIALIKAICDCAESVCLLLRTDTEISENPELHSMNTLIARLKREIPCEVEELGGESFSPQIELWTAAHICDECEFVAAKIRQLITKKGYACNEIAVLECDRATTPRLKEAMSEYEIPYYSDLPEPIITKPMTRFIVAALQAVCLDTPSLLFYIRSGFVRVRGELENYSLKSRSLVLGKVESGGGSYTTPHRHYGGFTKRLSKRSMDLLERAAHRYALTDREWGKPFPQHNRELYALEPLRAAIVQPLIDLRESCKNKCGDEITEALCAFLLDTMQLQRTVLGLCEGLSPVEQQDGIEALQGDKLPLQQEFRQLWDLIIDVFESLHESLKDYPLSLGEYSELLCGVFSSVKIAKPPQVLDAVVIGDLERSRLRGIRVGFVVGANAGAFPKSAAIMGDGVFSGRELEALSESGLEVCAGLEQRYSYERLMVNKALTLPSQRLYITAPLSDAAWAELLPSPVFEQLTSERGLPLNKTVDLPLHFRATTLKSAKRILAEEGYTELERVVGKAGKPVCERHSLSGETSSRLFGFELPNFRFSPTAIETMMCCRFRYFCRYGLGIDIPVAQNEEEPIALERGNIIHYCLDRAMRQSDSLKDGDLDGFVEACIKEYRSIRLPYDYAKTKRQEYILMSFKTGIVRMLRHIRRDFEGSAFKPHDFEKQFDFKLNDISFKGQIDRIDRERSGNGVRVVDYKSGSKEFDFPSVFYGLNLQLLLYLFSECDKGDSRPSAALYMPSDGVKTDGILLPDSCSFEARKSWLTAHTPSGIAIDDSDLDEQERRYRTESNATARKAFFKLKRLSLNQYDRLKDYCGKLLNTQINRVKSGNVDAFPVESACDYCEFSLACGNDRSRVKSINKELIERVIDNVNKSMD